MTDAVSPTQSQLQTSLQFSNQLAATVAAAAQSVVAVHGGGRRPPSGIVWQPGIVVTAEETVVHDADLALTLPDGNRVEATLAGRDPSTDIAVLRYEATPPIKAFASTKFATIPMRDHGRRAARKGASCNWARSLSGAPRGAAAARSTQVP
jgi:S1-C subfamily serine protease